MKPIIVHTIKKCLTYPNVMYIAVRKYVISNYCPQIFSYVFPYYIQGFKTKNKFVA